MLRRQQFLQPVVLRADVLDCISTGSCVSLTVANQGKLPTKLATAVATAPHHKLPRPYALMRSLKIPTPCLPCVCMVVLSVSIGTRIILKSAPAIDAKTVFNGEGSLFKKGLEDRSARIPTFAAVSPKRAIGPWIRAGRRPW